MGKLAKSISRLIKKGQATPKTGGRKKQPKVDKKRMKEVSQQWAAKNEQQRKREQMEVQEYRTQRIIQGTKKPKKGK